MIFNPISVRLLKKLVTDSSSVVRLIGLDLNDGQLSYDIALPIWSNTWVGAGQYLAVNPLNGEVFVGGPNNSDIIYHAIYKYVHLTLLLIRSE
jgi:hypothetical protein